MNTNNIRVEDCRIEHPTERLNFAIVYFDDCKIAFSYETPIGYASASTCWEWKVRVNEWGVTTGKHMTYLGCGADDRIPAWRFENYLYFHGRKEGVNDD